MKSIILILFCSSLANADDFAARAQSLRSSQAETDALLSHLKTKYRIATGPLAATNDFDEKARTLFVKHASLGTLRAPLGKTISAMLMNRLLIGGDPSPVILTVDETETSMQGLTLIGVAKPAGTEGRIAVDVTRLVFKSGKTQTIQASILDEDGAYGIAAQVLSKKALAVAGAMASSFVSGVAASQITQNQTAFGVTTQAPSGRNALLQGVAQTAADQSKRLIDESTAEKPILVLEAGARVKVFFSEEARF